MQVTCSCGKVLSVPDTLAGKTVRCPACQKIFKVVGPPASPAAQPPRIQVDCTCGKKLSAPLSAAGKMIHCPKCNQEIVVPTPPPAKPPPAPASYAATPGSPGAAPPKPVPVVNDELTFELDAPLADIPAPAPPKSAGASKPAPPAKPASPRPAPAVPPKAPPSSPLEDSPGGHAEKAEYGLSAPRCPNCKAELAMGAQFCVECGTALATGTKMQSAATPQKKKGIQMDPEMIKKIVIGAVAAAAIGFGGYMAYKSLWAPRGTMAPRPSQTAPKAAPKGPAPAAPMHHRRGAEGD